MTPVRPNVLLNWAETAGVAPKFAAHGYARLFEALKDISGVSSQSTKLPRFARNALTVIALASAAASMAFYSGLGRKWLGLDDHTEASHGTLSALGEMLAPPGLFSRSDAQNNATNLPNIIGSLASYFSRMIPVRDGAPWLAAGLNSIAVAMSAPMAAMETDLADLLYEKPVVDAGKGVAAGGGVLLPNLVTV